MNFTVLAMLFSTLVLAYFLLQPQVYLELGYTPLEKIEALDYIAAVNALATAQRGGDPRDFLGSEASILALTVTPSCKRIVVEFNHTYYAHNVTVELCMRVLRADTEVTPAGRVVRYVVEVRSDRPVPTDAGFTATPRGVVVSVEGEVCDVRGLCVSP